MELAIYLLSKMFFFMSHWSTAPLAEMVFSSSKLIMNDYTLNWITNNQALMGLYLLVLD